MQCTGSRNLAPTYGNCVCMGGGDLQFMMLRKSRGLCGVEVGARWGGGGKHRLDCVLALHPDNLNSCKLNQLSGLPRGTTPEETEAMPERTSGEGAKSCEHRSQAQL